MYQGIFDVLEMADPVCKLISKLLKKNPKRSARAADESIFKQLYPPCHRGFKTLQNSRDERDDGVEGKETPAGGIPGSFCIAISKEKNVSRSFVTSHQVWPSG